jgi:glycine betaine/choline ABC-type transport system substrate-binding protein
MKGINFMTKDQHETSEVDRPHTIQLQLSEKELQEINEIAAQEGKSPQEVAHNLISDFLKS